MTATSISRLEYLIGIAPSLLAAIGEPELSAKQAPHVWSKKELIGHLIDSAANNHQRFIRGQFEQSPEIGYDQNNGNTFNYYQQLDGAQLISFWTLYNSHLAAVIKRIPEHHLANEVRVGAGSYTLAFLITDYVAHLEHHLRQLIHY